MTESDAATADLSMQLFKAAEAGDLQAVKAAIDQGADLTYQHDEGVTALMTAAENGHVDIVTQLLQAGAPWNQQDSSGYCAGEYATASKNQQIVEMLLDWGVQTELLLAASQRAEQATSTSGSGQHAPTTAANAGYLQQKLVYEGDRLLDANGEAVMMGWEAPLMERHAAVICGQGGRHYLNVGFGLGIIDNLIQEHHPASHTIIEAHPDVYSHMCDLGWDRKPGVQILFGRWQDVQQQLGEYDGIFFDTYGEYYEELRQFHLLLPKILKPDGVYSYFNGLASDNFFFHMVYGRLVQVELQSLSLQTKFEQLRVAELGDEVWQGVRNRYWHFPVYFLPVVSPMDKTTAAEAAAAAADAEVPGAAAGPRDHDDQAADVPA